MLCARRLLLLLLLLLLLALPDSTPRRYCKSHEVGAGWQ